MKISTLLSLAAFLCLIWAVEWIVGVPVPDDEGSSSKNSTQDQPTSDHQQGFPFRESNDSSHYIVVDDMVITRDPSRAGMVNAAWPNGEVPYSMAMTLTPQQRPMILQAMNELSAISCIKFRPATREDTYNIEFRNDPMNQGCSSYVGWQNRKNQPVQLSTMCSKGNAIHEVLHALGFFHEQTRDDRDEYVQIKFENISPGFENNFKKDGELYPDAETSYFDVPYNYDSIMHYGKTYFSKNGANTIEVLNNPDAVGRGDNVGQRDFISEGDMQMLRQKYDCPDVPEEPETGAPDEGEATTAKPTTKNPMCQYQPSLPMCKRK
ncbi:unnamed protein product [Orchesella dallaii]|uniref:Metalloendopeptidase n=1 Tax=Orchesella dallaii TaxID=48710 RepID=A0ABP1Q4S0_9HEXA